MSRDEERKEGGFKAEGASTGSMVDQSSSIAEDWNYELDYCLDEFLANNFDKVFEGKLKLYVDSEGQIGWRYPTPIGQIDMLAVEEATGSLVVVKIKPGWATEEDLGRLLAEMQWVGENLQGGNSDVKGWIICKHKQRLLDFTAKTYNVVIKRYKFGFKLED
jgi:hypothetical protein